MRLCPGNRTGVKKERRKSRHTYRKAGTGRNAVALAEYTYYATEARDFSTVVMDSARGRVSLGKNIL